MPAVLTLQKWLSICYIFGATVLVYFYVKWVPHYVGWVVSAEHVLNVHKVMLESWRR